MATSGPDTGLKGRQPRLLLSALLVIAVLVAVFFLTNHQANATSLSARLPLPSDTFNMSLNRLWGQAAEALEVEANGALLDDLEIRYSVSGDVDSLHMQVLTQDHCFITLGFGPLPSGYISLHGSRIPNDQSLPRSSWTADLDRTFAVLERLGLSTLRDQPDIPTGASGYKLSLAINDTHGSGSVPWQERAYLWEAGGFVRLHPEDPRRAFKAEDVCLVLGLSRPYEGGGIQTSDWTYFIVPEEAQIDMGVVKGV